jgi:hypothetical protein
LNSRLALTFLIFIALAAPALAGDATLATQQPAAVGGCLFVRLQTVFDNPGAFDRSKICTFGYLSHIEESEGVSFFPAPVRRLAKLDDLQLIPVDEPMPVPAYVRVSPQGARFFLVGTVNAPSGCYLHPPTWACAPFSRPIFLIPKRIARVPE